MTEKDLRPPIKGRGTSHNPDNRFERLHYALDWDEETVASSSAPKTEFFRDSSRTIVNENDSPDISFRFSVNPYRGCEHGCAYCYARPSHEYLGFSAGLDFETRIFIKEDAPDLLREKLASRSWKPELIMMSGITDCYQPIERKLELTRRCLQVLAEFRNPVSLITKNALIKRDLDIFLELNKFDCVSVCLSVTTLDDKLAAALEPRTSRPAARLETIRTFAENGIPVSVNVAPVIPGLTDHEMPKILQAAADCGAKSAGMTPLRLPATVLPVFLQWLEENRPERKAKVLSRLRDLRGGKLNDPNFGSRMRGLGPVADSLRQMFDLYSKRFHLNGPRKPLSTEHFRKNSDQLTLF